jgi:hypothetical protein
MRICSRSSGREGLLFGATGMAGQGVSRECLIARDVERVLVVGRSPTGHTPESRSPSSNSRKKFPSFFNGILSVHGVVFAILCLAPQPL